MDADFDEDEMLIRAMEESLRHYEEVERPLQRLREDAELAAPQQSSTHVTGAATRQSEITKPIENFTSFKSFSPNSTGSPFKAHVDSSSSSKKDEKDSPVVDDGSFKDDPKPSSSRINSDSFRSIPGPSREAFKPGPSRSSLQTNTLFGLWEVMGTKEDSTANKDKVIQNGEKVQRLEPEQPLQLLSDATTLTDDGFCMFTGRHWVYPTNYPERKYQLDMVQTALFHNTLVCLPTGLGKTFIAAVVMYNFYRWYPKGKIIFMAPTKPLVAQQIRACYDITGISKEHTEEMTGTMNAERRTHAWKRKRVFFATPQVVVNDLVAQICPAENVRCIVVDEAHRAQGDFAYCQVVSTLRSATQNFRLLALSATPGSDINAVKQVIQNLHISKMKIATEDSPEVAQYTHHREVEIITVANTPELNEARDRFQTIMGQYLQPLIQNNIVSGYNLANLTHYQMKMSLDKLSKNAPNWLSKTELFKLQSLCVVSITLCHAQELLQNYGLRSFLSYIQGVLQDSKTNKTVLGYLSSDENLLKLIEELNERLTGRTNKEGDQSFNGPRILYGHPKLQKLQQIVADHFLSYEDRNEETRAIIFCQYRDSVEEIKNLLQPLEPFVKPMSFVGQAKSKGSAGLTQKKQLQVMRDFRSGGFNTLISTSVGEEGLDIGEVDLIVCMDASKSPIRLVQRMGRTGRKRAGKIIMLLSEGKEHKKYIDSTKRQSSISKNILSNKKLLLAMDQISSLRMVPKGLHPTIYRTILVIPQEAKDQDIRKVIRKASALPDLSPALLSAAEAASWDGKVPDFKHLETMISNDFLVFQPLDTVLDSSSQNSQKYGKKTAGFDMFEYLEWQRSLQGTNYAFHSKESHALVALLQLADKMTLDNPEVLTQTSELVTEVDHDALWGTINVKGRGRGKKGRGPKDAQPTGPRRGDIAWCLQQQGQNTKQLKSPESFNQVDDDVFIMPSKPAPRKAKSPEAGSSLPKDVIETMKRLSMDENKVAPDNPLYKTLQYTTVACNALRRTQNEFVKPDLANIPDISMIDTILTELRIEVTEKKKGESAKVVDKQHLEAMNEDFSPNTMQEIAVLTEMSPVIKKRKFTRHEPSTSTFEPQLLQHSKISPQSLNSKSSLENKNSSYINATAKPSSSKSDLIGLEKHSNIMAQSKKMPENEIEVSVVNVPKLASEGEKTSQTALKSNKTVELSQGMQEFLMNFNLGFEEDDSFTILDEKGNAKKENGSLQITKTTLINENIEENKVISKTEKCNETEGNMKKSTISEVPVSKTDTNSENPSAKVQAQMNFDIFGDDDDDLFADVDLSSWMGEFEKRGKESQVQQLANETLVSPKNPCPNEKPSSVSSTPAVTPLFRSSADTIKLTPSSTSSSIKRSPDIFDGDEMRSPVVLSNRGAVLTMSNSNRSPSILGLSKIGMARSSIVGSSPVTLADTVKLTPSSITTTSVERSPDILVTNKNDTASPTITSSVKQGSSNGTPILNRSPLIIGLSNVGISPNLFTSSSSNTPSPKQTNIIEPKGYNTELGLKPLAVESKVPSKLSMKNRVKNAAESEVPQICKTSRLCNLPSTPEVHQVPEMSEAQNKSVSDEESFIEALKRRNLDGRQALIVSSDDSSPDTTLRKNQNSTEVPTLTVSSENDENSSPDSIPQQAITISSSSDEEFSRPTYIMAKRKNLEKRQDKAKKHKKGTRVQAFLDMEAEVSGDENSEDEAEGSQLDKYDESFIKAEATQVDSAIDMKAQYLRSVRSPIHGQGRFKIPQLQPGRGRLLSPGDHDESSYINDSFCVNTDGELDSSEKSSDSDAELDKLEAKLERKKNYKKRNRHDLSSQDEEEKKKAENSKKLRRIICHSSSDEEIQEIIPSLQRDSPVPPPPPPLAASTPNMVQGFENDYVDDDADLDELIACISMSQALEQAQLAQQVTKNPISRSLFKDQEQDDSAGGNCEPKQLPNDINIPSTSNDQQSTYKKQPTLADPLEHKLKLPNVESKKSLSLVKPSRQLSPPKLIPQIQLGPPKLQTFDTVVDQAKIARVPAVMQKPANQVDEISDKITAVNKKPLVENTVIIAATRQVVSGPKLLTILRHNHNVSIQLQTLPQGVDYVVSQRLAIGRLPIQDVNSCNENSDIVATVRSVRQQFKFVVLVLENNSTRPLYEPRKEPSKHATPGAKALRTALCLMRQVDGLKVVFSKDQAETASIIKKLALKEQQCDYGIKQYSKESCDPAFDARLKFFTNLPGVNIALALKLVNQYPTLADFIKKCSNIEGIEKTLNINRRQASTLNHVLSRPLQ